jgi:hypothetical protein
MNELKTYLQDLANTDIAHSETKIEQKASRQIKENLNSLMLQALESLASNDIQILRTAKGIGIAIDNEKVGFIPIEINITIKNLDYDIVEENIAYNEKLESDKIKKAEKEKAKATKIARQKAIKEQAQKLKELKESE